MLSVISKNCCDSLESLFLNQCANVTAIGIVKLSACTRLQGLTLPTCVSDVVLETLSASLHALAVADVSGNIAGQPTPFLTGSGIASLIRRCPALRTLNASDCRGVGDSAFITPLAEGGGHALRILSLQCLPITDTALAAIGRSCPNLVSIDLSRNANVSDNGITSLVHGCTLLATIIVPWCTLLTDNALTSIGSSSASGLLVLPTYLNIIELRALDIFGCELISSQAVLDLLRARRVLDLNCEQDIIYQLAGFEAHQAIIRATSIHCSRTLV